MSYECDACGDAFRTLSKKRLHDCPEGAKYGGDEPVADIPVADLDLDAQVELAVEQVLICDVCGEKNDGAESIDQDTNERGVAIAVEFRCEHCGATNENTATFE